MAVGEVFLSAFLQVLFDRLASRELLDVATSLKIDADLKKLTLLVSKLNAVLKDAEERQDNDMAVKLWIDELRDVADDAEDALDEFATVILECKLKAGNKKSRSWTELLQDMLRPNTPVGAIIFNAKVTYCGIAININKRVYVRVKRKSIRPVEIASPTEGRRSSIFLGRD